MNTFFELRDECKINTTVLLVYIYIAHEPFTVCLRTTKSHIFSSFSREQRRLVTDWFIDVSALLSCKLDYKK